MTTSELSPAPAAKLTGKESRFSPWLTKIIYPVGRVFLPTYFSAIEISGQEHVPPTGAVIIAPTHRSRWDSLLVPYVVGPYVTGRDVRFMVSQNEMRGVQGWFVRRLGGFPVDTNRPGLSTIRHSMELLHQGEMLTIYPEGNLFYDGGLHPLKPGLARIAMQTIASNPELALKIVPIVFKYSRPEPQFGDRVSIAIGKPLDVVDYREQTTKVGTQNITADLTLSMKQLTSEVN
jgi:1-acyl-sn-glycerol-3-phosphate acyltransferase